MSLNSQMHGPNTRYSAIDPSLFVSNRERLSRALLPNALVVLHANDVMPVNGDDVMPFKQNSDLFYCAGIDQEETILLLYPDAREERYQAVLFLKESTPEVAVWEGAKYTYEEARKASGIETIYPLSDFDKVFNQLVKQVDYVYLNMNEHGRATVEVEGRGERFIRWCKERYPLHSYQRLAPVMGKLRMIKSSIEIDLIRKACQITGNAFKEILPKIKGGMKEYEIEALFIESFTRQGSDGFAFTPIVASGKRACVLHYIANNNVCEAGELLLLDVGAVYAHYRSDVTRVVPVSGSFTRRQKEVYKGVMQVMEEAKKLLVVGNDLVRYHRELGKVMEEVLLSLGLLTRAEVKAQDTRMPLYKKYCMHGVSHHLGLGTHDFSDMYATLAEGMVLTIEPGIYIPEEGIGIRLENDVVIRKDGVENLTYGIELTPDGIEELMKG